MKKMVLDRRFFLLTLAMLLVAAGTFSLGEWQLRRAQKKLDLQTAIEARKSLQAVDVQAISATNNIADFVHRPATLQGKWRDENTVFLDNRPMGGKTGFIVVTPLVLNGSAQVILVQRGWVARSFTERTSLPAIVTPGGLVTVNGRIAPPPSKLYEFKGIEVGRIRQNLDVTVFQPKSAVPFCQFRCCKPVRPVMVCCEIGQRPIPGLKSTMVMLFNGSLSARWSSVFMYGFN